MHVCVCMCGMTFRAEVNLWSVLSTMLSWGLEFRLSAWRQAPWPTKSSCWTKIFVYLFLFLTCREMVQCGGSKTRHWVRLFGPTYLLSCGSDIIGLSPNLEWSWGLKAGCEEIHRPSPCALYPYMRLVDSHEKTNLQLMATFAGCPHIW